MDVLSSKVRSRMIWNKIKKMKNEVKIDEKVILIRINQLFKENMSDLEIYEATRGVWRIGDRRKKAEYAFSVFEGYIKEVFQIKRWLVAGTLKYSTIPQQEMMVAGRWELEGVIANPQIRQKYLGKCIKSYFPKGASNPIMYVNC